MLKYPVYIDLEGSDLVGKSTLLKTTFKKSDYSKILCFHDRGVLTHYVYNLYFNRYPEDHIMWAKEVLKFIENNGIVILVADENTIRERFFARSDDLFKLVSIIAINQSYKDNYRNFLYYFPTIKLIDTSNKSPEEIYEDAENFYKFMLERSQK